MIETSKLLPLVFALAACGGETTELRPAIPEETVAKPHPKKPQSDEPEFLWKQVGEESAYTPDNIWELIDGAAEIYVAYGFKGLVERRYELQGCVATVDIFDQGEPMNAFGVFSRESPPDAERISAGAMGAAVEPYQCMMIKGRYYVRAQAMQGDLNAPECRGLLVAAARDLPGGDDPPPELGSLPSRGRVAGSLGFSRKSYLGLADLSNCLFAKYRMGDGREFELFTILPRGEQTAEGVWRELGGKWQAAKVNDLPALHRDIPYRGKVAVVRTPERILGVVDAGDLDLTLETLREALATD